MSPTQSQQIKALKQELTSEIQRRIKLENAVADYVKSTDNLRRALQESVGLK